MHTLVKSEAGPWPEPTFPAGIDLRAEAARSRRRMAAVSVLYPAYLVALLALAWRDSMLVTALGWCAVGVLAWSPIEYLVHRWLLHVAFPAGRSRWSRAMNRLFDASHVDHHARPWDGYHINGHLDTLLLAVWAFPLGHLAPRHTASAALAGLFAAYLAEEWLHHAMHFRNFQWRYFQYLRRRHLFHHSRSGVGTAFGITSDVWDRVFGTRIPLPFREQLRPARRRAAGSVARA